MTDITMRHHGSICIAEINTPAGDDWFAEHVSDEAQWFGRGIVVETRYAEDIINGLREDGLTVEVTL